MTAIPRVVVYEKGQRATHVIIRGQLFPWQEKAPYTRSGNSILGAIEYEAKTKKMKCHICGGWHDDIGFHVQRESAAGSSVHSTSRNYKLLHGFRTDSSLMTPKRRKQAARIHASALAAAAQARKVRALKKFSPAPPAAPRSKRINRILLGLPSGRSENANLVAACQAQRIADLLQCATRIGRTPTHVELKKFTNKAGLHTLYPKTLERLFDLPMRAIFAAAGIAYRRDGVNVRSATPMPQRPPLAKELAGISTHGD